MIKKKFKINTKAKVKMVKLDIKDPKVTIQEDNMLL